MLNIFKLLKYLVIIHKLKKLGARTHVLYAVFVRSFTTGPRENGALLLSERSPVPDRSSKGVCVGGVQTTLFAKGSKCKLRKKRSESTLFTSCADHRRKWSTFRGKHFLFADFWLSLGTYMLRFGENCYRSGYCVVAIRDIELRWNSNFVFTGRNCTQWIVLHICTTDPCTTDRLFSDPRN